MTNGMAWWTRPQPELETREASATNAAEWFREIFGTSAPAISVTPATAMRCTPVRAAVQAIAEPVGTMPFHLFARDNNGAKERDREHPVSRLLSDRVNPWTPSSSFREQLTRDACLHGNGFAAINRVNGTVRELNRLDPSCVTVEVDTGTREPRYVVDEEGGRRTLVWADVLHIQAPSLDGTCGDSPVRQCKDAIGVALALEAHNSALFRNAARPGGVIEHPGSLGEDALKRMKAGWAAAHEGAANAGRTAVLWDGAKYNATTFTSVDAQVLETRRFAIDEIARTFRVPPHMLFEMGRATWGNAAEMGATFLRFGLRRWLSTWEAEVRLKLLSDTEAENHFAEFVTDGLLQSDLPARAAAYGQMIAARVLNPNEVRALENRPPYEGGDVFENPNTATGAA